MVSKERIEKGLYWDRAWYLVQGCTPVSAGCTNCWAAREAHMRAHQKNPKIREKYEGLTTPEGKWNGRTRFSMVNLDLPFRAKKSWTWVIWNDLFHENVPFGLIDEAFKVMALSPQQTFLMLTKRPGRALDYYNRIKPEFIEEITELNTAPFFHVSHLNIAIDIGKWPLPNVFLGVTAENQKAADERISILLQIPAAVHWVSCEPLLSPIDLSGWLEFTWACPECGDMSGFVGERCSCGEGVYVEQPRLNWVVAGGETGPNARPMHPDWVRSLRDQCQAAGVPFFFKSWGEYLPCDQEQASAFLGGTEEPLFAPNPEDYSVKVGKKAAGRILDGVEHNEFPEVPLWKAN